MSTMATKEAQCVTATDTSKTSAEESPQNPKTEVLMDVAEREGAEGGAGVKPGRKRQTKKVKAAAAAGGPDSPDPSASGTSGENSKTEEREEGAGEGVKSRKKRQTKKAKFEDAAGGGGAGPSASAEERAGNSNAGVKSGRKRQTKKVTAAAAAGGPGPSTAGSTGENSSDPKAKDAAAGERQNQVYQFKVTLLHTKPPIWRRIQMGSGSRFSDLHDAIVSSMGWADYHLHQFKMHGRTIGVPHEDDRMWGGDRVSNENNVKIKRMFTRVKQSCKHEYDFGDSWEHRVLLEKILPAQENEDYPKCVGGKRACPPEDCGGVYGYERLMGVWAKPDEEQRTDAR